MNRLALTAVLAVPLLLTALPADAGGRASGRASVVAPATVTSGDRICSSGGSDGRVIILYDAGLYGPNSADELGAGDCHTVTSGEAKAGVTVTIRANRFRVGYDLKPYGGWQNLKGSPYYGVKNFTPASGHTIYYFQADV